MQAPSILYGVILFIPIQFTKSTRKRAGSYNNDTDHPALKSMGSRKEKRDEAPKATANRTQAATQDQTPPARVQTQ
jgi:hypothetical protein